MIGNGKVWENASQNRTKHLEQMSLGRAKMSHGTEIYQKCLSQIQLEKFITQFLELAVEVKVSLNV